MVSWVRCGTWLYRFLILAFLFTLESCKTIILLVGGNDADSGTDLDTFTNKYEERLTSLLADSHRVIAAGLPRHTTDLSLYDEMLQQLSNTYEIEVIENYKGFLLAPDALPESYFKR